MLSYPEGRRSLFPGVILLGLAIGGIPPAAIAATTEWKVAVLELRNQARLTDDETDYLTDRVRDAAAKVLVNDPVAKGMPWQFLVLTRENIQELLPPDIKIADCTQAQCEVEIGRKLGADYVVTGTILTFADELRLALKAHECAKGALIGGETAEGRNKGELERALGPRADSLFILVRRHAGESSTAESGPGFAPGEIGAQPPAPWEMPAIAEAVVSFESDPPGAVVMVDGQLKCQSTPCRKTLPVGQIRVSMSSERYFSREEMVEVRPGMGPLHWTLSPNFGWIVVSSEPPGISVRIDDKDAGVTPVARRELDPGQHVVLVSDPRYYEKGEKFLLQPGETKTIAVTLPPREGGIRVSVTDAYGDDVDGDVFIDDRPVGRAPGTFKVLIGRHDVRVVTRAGDWSGSTEVTERTVADLPVRVSGRGRQIAPAAVSVGVPREGKGLMIAGAVAFAGAGAAGLLADNAYKKYEGATTASDAAHFRKQTRALALTANALYGVGGISVVIGAYRYFTSGGASGGEEGYAVASRDDRVVVVRAQPRAGTGFGVVVMF